MVEEEKKDDDKSILDTKCFGDCRKDDTLMVESLKAFLYEGGFPITSMPSDAILGKILNTFAATVAIRSGLPVKTTMRRVIGDFDKVMLNYAAARVTHDPTCLMKNESTNLADDSPMVTLQ